MASKDRRRSPILDDMENQRPGTTTCDEVRSTRLHYQLRCLLHEGHDGEHRWTPELVPMSTDGATG
jgi:hypothetical protein